MSQQNFECKKSLLAIYNDARDKVDAINKILVAELQHFAQNIVREAKNNVVVNFIIYVHVIH